MGASPARAPGPAVLTRTTQCDSEHGTLPTPDDLLSEEDKVLLKRRIFALKRNALPPVTTHNMADDPNDTILNQIRRVQLFNSSTDRVKIVFHPDFLNSNNPILGLDYEGSCAAAISACSRATTSHGATRPRSAPSWAYRR